MKKEEPIILQTVPLLLIPQYLLLIPGPALFAGLYCRKQQYSLWRNGCCIYQLYFWGSETNVINEFEVAKEGSLSFSIILENCIYKGSDPQNCTLTGCLPNADPVFTATEIADNIFDFHLSDGSPAIDAGISTLFSSDLDNNNRSIGNTDIGCYENNR